jgi:hypothetical protein
VYRLGLDPIAEDQITAVPQEALRPLAELLTVLETASWSGEPFSSAHRYWLTDGPPGVIPAASAAATYFRTVFRDSPRRPTSSFFDRPACQSMKISQISITSNVLLVTGPRPSTEA